MTSYWVSKVNGYIYRRSKIFAVNGKNYYYNEKVSEKEYSKAKIEAMKAWQK